jgi:A/G-specific adenine glycosylase
MTAAAEQPASTSEVGTGMLAEQVSHRLLPWGAQHFQSFPWRERIPDWQALLAEILLQRTRASQVVPVFDRLATTFISDNPAAKRKDEEILEILGPLGLHWRRRLLLKLRQELLARNLSVPTTREELLTLPGVGPYIAAAMLSLHLNRRAVIIDSNVVRVLCRLVGRSYDGETRRKTWLKELADRLTPQEGHRAYNYALLDLAMTVCVPNRPLCRKCPLADICEFSGARATTKEHAFDTPLVTQ